MVVTSLWQDRATPRRRVSSSKLVAFCQRRREAVLVLATAIIAIRRGLVSEHHCDAAAETDSRLHLRRPTAFVCGGVAPRIQWQLSNSARAPVQHARDVGTTAVATEKKQRRNRPASEAYTEDETFGMHTAETVNAALGTPRTSLGESADEVWSNAAESAAFALAGVNNTAATILMPSGAGEIIVGLRTVLKYREYHGKDNFKSLVLVPPNLMSLATRLYEEQTREANLKVHTMKRAGTEVRDLVDIITSPPGGGVVILGTYEDLNRIALAQRHVKKAQELDLAVFEMAHLARAGGYRNHAMIDYKILECKKRVFISARRLFGLAPGALLAPGQESNYPKEAAVGEFGPEVFRITHEDTVQRKMSVPIQLAFLNGASVSDVANELAELGNELGVRKIHIVSSQPKLQGELDKMLKNLTDGNTSVETGVKAGGRSLDAILLAGSNPDFVSIAQEFSRLGRWQEGKKAGYILVTTAAKLHAVAAWQALAIENQDAEEAIQQSAVETGSMDRPLEFKEIPQGLKRLMDSRASEEDASLAANRGIKALGDPWDAWLGRLAAFRNEKGHGQVRYLATIFGHELGAWVKKQRSHWERGDLDEVKIARLRRMGVMLDLDVEVFAHGIAELRKYVSRERQRVVPLSYICDNGFKLGEWVVEMRTRQRRGRLTYQRQQLLKEAFFVWRPSEASGNLPALAKHPEDPEAADLTHQIEDELRALRWQASNQRRRLFREMVLHHHPDVSEEKHAAAAIQFLADVKEWFLANN